MHREDTDLSQDAAREWKVLRSLTPMFTRPGRAVIKGSLIWSNRNLAGEGTSHIPGGSSLQACDLSMTCASSNGGQSFTDQSSLVIFLPRCGERAAQALHQGKDVGSEVRRGRCAPLHPCSVGFQVGECEPGS